MKTAKYIKLKKEIIPDNTENAPIEEKKTTKSTRKRNQPSK